MDEYIKKADAVKLCEDYREDCIYNCDFIGASDFNRLEEDIEQLSTADVVEVVRCKDCKYYERYSIYDDDYYCMEEHTQSLFSPNKTDFCSYGERKDVSKMEITTEVGAE